MPCGINDSNVQPDDDLSVDHLRDDLLHFSSECASEAVLTEISFQSAQKCVADLGSLSTSKAHIDNVRVGTETVWSRQDPRVSFEIFQIVFNFAPNRQIIIHHQSSPKDKSRRRIVILFDTVLGIVYNTATSTIGLHICKPPSIMSKTNESKTWQPSSIATTAQNDTVIPVSIIINVQSDSPSKIQAVLKQDPALQRPLSPTKTYSSNPAHVQHPAKWFPVVRHPKLVRAAQMASLVLLEEARAMDKDLNWLLRRYFGLERRFNELLKQ